MYCSPKLEYHTIPCESTTTSCGSIVARGRSYSVMMTCVAVPLGRGNVLRGYSHFEAELKLIVGARHACEPFRIRQLGRESLRVVHREIGCDRLVPSNFDGSGIIHLVSH